MTSAPAYRLLRSVPPPVAAPVLDARQQQVVDHPGGPLLVLAGPGTGKTTTLVEAVVARVRRGLKPEQVLVLTFSRKAAAELRERITGRIGATLAAPAAWTFHAFCYALTRAYADEEPARLLSSPEQQVRLRELLAGSAELGTVTWPELLRQCLHTQGFAEEVRAVFSRARALGLEPAGLAAAGRAAGRSVWVAGARFFDEYHDVLDAERAIDYPELVHRARSLLTRPDVLERLRAQYPVVFVDEYQDSDPAQEGLLRQLAGQGRDLVAFGDPDQSVYAFRGADVGGVLRFPDRFRTRDGTPAPVLTLGVSRRAGPVLLEVSRALATRLPAPGLPAQTVREHRDLRAAPGRPPGQVEVLLFRSPVAEALAVADALRRAHLHDGLAWSAMAVLVRSGVASIPLLRRTLTASGVPVDVAGDEVPLGREPAVLPLLAALRCADDEAELTPEVARHLLLSPLGGADPGGLRRLGRALRQQERDAGAPLPRPSAILLRDAVADSALLTGVDDPTARPARRLGDLIRAVRAKLHHGSTPEDALWALWSGTWWPRDLERRAYAGGPAGRAADRDLDAVVALFEAVARAERRRGRRGVRNLLEELAAQEIPGDTLAERGVRGGAVRLLTAHRSKGLEWDLVVVAGVQDGTWPDLRQRGSLLEAERIERGGARAATPRTALLAEERRLCYVAVTRARRRLVVTAVDSPDDDGLRPSPFLAELGVPVRAADAAPERRPLTLAALVAELRRAATEPGTPEPLRQAAVARLAMLAPHVPAADPGTWWGLVDVTASPHPLRAGDEPVALSGSSLAGLQDCPLRWFLDHEVRAGAATSAAQGFGSIVHALADEVATRTTAAELDELMRRLDLVWPQLAFEAPWQADQQRTAARDAITRYLAWHHADRPRTFVASEHDFDVTVGRLRLRGSMDRVERDAAGRYVVADFKTGKTPPPKGDLPEHPQLGTYQYAVAHGALGDLAPGAEPGGAELVQLRKDGRDGLPLVQAQDPPLPDADGLTWIDRRLAEAVDRIVAEDFPPQPGESCSWCAFRRCCPALPEGRQVVS